MMNGLERDLEEIKNSLGTLSRQVGGNNFLVTGGAGFIGSWFCDALISMGGRVVCVDNLSSGDEKNIEHLKREKKFKFMKVPVEKFEPEEKFDFIVHMASIASPPLYQKFPIETLDSGVIGTKRMLELAAKQKVKSFLFTSTSEIYGNPPEEMVPTPESYYGYVNSFGPRSMYDESKRCAEAYCYSYWKQFGVPVRVARIFNTYGPRLDTKNPTGYGRALIKFVYLAINDRPINIYGNGEQTRSFCYITDQVAGLLKLLLKTGINGEVFNIGSDDEVSINNLIRAILRLTNSSSKLINTRPAYDITDDPTRRKPDITKAKKILQWGPNMGLEGGLEKTIRWVKAGKD
ncbi:MAG: NAD-dependent epimerase/dehydratase family protein [Candidatus Aenigmarchaeota archaeon]|nr:NAD-dependent epimerase/dehydratase family protein [Candidatus Aenigmarchaeota archaeon]